LPNYQFFYFIHGYCPQGGFQIPHEEDLGGVYNVGGAFVENLSSVYVRVVARLASICERGEDACGLARLEAPAPEEA